METRWRPLRLHPDNPHYFEFRGRPTILFTSGEHYAMPINLAFDYMKYLDALGALGFNHSRVYTGVKRERPGEHSIDGNALAVPHQHFICPWVRTDVPGALDGGNKYDLDQWNQAYFDRFKAILAAAGERGIELEIVLHGPLHMGGDSGDGVGPWGICPLNGANNVNGVGRGLAYAQVNSLEDPLMVAYQDKYVRKLVVELNGFDNLHYEICNEPYTFPPSTDGAFGPMGDPENLRLKWQQHVADVVYGMESQLPNRHLISCNYMNGFSAITHPIRHVDLYSFHYTHPCVAQINWAMNVAIGMNETGIMAHPDYVKQAWIMMVSGLALYNMLDYTFTPGHEAGTYALLPTNPAYTGMTGPALRDGLRRANDFINTFDFIHMRPANDLIVYDIGCNSAVYMLAQPDRQYAIYHADNQHSNSQHYLNIGVKAADGDYQVEVIDPDSAQVLASRVERASGGLLDIFYRKFQTHAGNRPFRAAVRAVRIHEHQRRGAITA